jgi:hypothetical protein
MFARQLWWARSPTHKAHPDFGCGQFDEGEVIFVVFFEAGGDGSKMLEFVEEAFDQVTEAIEVRAEGRDVECWLGLFEQIFGIAKWNACRV